MNKKQLFDAIDKIDDKYVSETEYYDPEKMKIRVFPIIRFMPAALITASVASVVVAVYLGSQIKPPGDYEIDNSVTESTTYGSEQYTGEVSDSLRPATEPVLITDGTESGIYGSYPGDTGISESMTVSSSDPNVIIVSGNTAVSLTPSDTQSGSVTRPAASPSASAAVSPTVGTTAKPTTSSTVKPTVTPTYHPEETTSEESTQAVTVPYTWPFYVTTEATTTEASPHPTAMPTLSPTRTPATGAPSSSEPSDEPTGSPKPTGAPLNPTPTSAPTMSPTSYPTGAPTMSPTSYPTGSPTMSPTSYPTGAPTMSPTSYPTGSPTMSPTSYPTGAPTAGAEPTLQPAAAPLTVPMPEAVFRNSDSLEKFITERDFEQDKYSQSLRDAAEKISSDGFFYVPGNSGFDRSEVVMVSERDSVDSGLMYYAYSDGSLCSIGIYSVDEDVFAQSESERAYIRNRYGEYDGNTYKLDSSDVWYNNEGAFFFIDEKHYCYIRSGLEDTEIKKIVYALSFDRVYF